MNIFTYLKCMLSGNMDQYLKAEELNNIYKTFKGKYHFISKERTIQPTFLTKVWNLSSQLKSLKSLLEQTLFDPDERKAAGFLTYTAQNFLPPESPAALFPNSQKLKNLLFAEAIGASRNQ